MSWEKVRLGEIVTLSKGKKHTPSTDGKNRYINIENLHNPINSLFTDESGLFVNVNDLVIAWDGANAGKVGVGFDGVIGSTLARLRLTRNDVEPKFLFWVLESKNELIKSQRTGATIPHVNGPSLKEIYIPLPSLLEQKRIAEILDAADELKRKDDELLKKYDELAQSIFIDMFGDPVRNEMGWKTMKLGDLITSFKYGTNEKSSYDNTGTAVLRIPNIIGNVINMSNLKYSQLENKEIEATKLMKGDLLFVRSNGNPNYIGRSAVFLNDDLYSYASYLIRGRLNSENISLSNYIQYALSYKTYRPIILKKATTTAGNYNINTESLKSLVVSVPDQNLLNKFFNIQEKINLQRKLISIQNVSEILFNTLIQKAFKGELTA